MVFTNALFFAAIECPSLTAPMNGQVSYATDMTSPYEIGTATFTCNAGFSLDGAADTLTCADDDQLDTVGTLTPHQSFGARFYELSVLL